ncbi:hypothetical protein, partial [Nocardioides sp.]|uniref:hypothetical protein n=1 Tax=Nocardioides sp. TaxID=35761 RepID=UPI0037C947DE
PAPSASAASPGRPTTEPARRPTRSPSASATEQPAAPRDATPDATPDAMQADADSARVPTWLTLTILGLLLVAIGMSTYAARRRTRH